MHIKSASRLREACEASSLNQLQVVHRTTRNLEKNGRRFETLLLVARESKCLAHCSSTASSFASAGSPGRQSDPKRVQSAEFRLLRPLGLA